VQRRYRRSPKPATRPARAAASTWTHLAPQQGGRGCAPPQRLTYSLELQHVVINYRHQHTGPNLLIMHCAIEPFTIPPRSLASWHQQAPGLDHHAVIDPLLQGQPPPPCPRDTDLVQLDRVPLPPERSPANRYCRASLTDLRTNSLFSTLTGIIIAVTQRFQPDGTQGPCMLGLTRHSFANLLFPDTSFSSFFFRPCDDCAGPGTA
jgi:hypothetical protein